MHDADTSRTERNAFVGDGSDLLDFARRTLAWAQEHERDTVVWYFKTRESIRRLNRTPELRDIGRALLKSETCTIANGIRIVLATKRSQVGGNIGGPLAVWWANDDQLLALDDTLWPMIDAYVSSPSRAPVWLTAFDVAVDAEVGVVAPTGGVTDGPSRVLPIVVSDELQEMVDRLSPPMNLVNGVYDSNADRFLAEARSFVRHGDATPEAVAVAALRSRWWPNQIADLVEVLSR